MAEKEVIIKVKTKTDTGEVEDLKSLLEQVQDNDVTVTVDTEDSEIKDTEKQIKKLDDEKPIIDIDTDTSEIDKAGQKIDSLDDESIEIPVTVEGEEQIDSVDEKIESSNGDSITVPVTVEGEEQLDAVDQKIESLNGKSITVPVNTDGEATLDSITNKLMGVAGGIGMVDQATKMWDASTQRQSANFYLASKLGTSKAREMQSAIQDIVSQVPGDDTFMNVMLSGSLAKQTNMTTNELRAQANVMADYMTASQMNGKNLLEAQQDLKSYILTGSTAELQRSSILSNQVDKLENQATIQDRINALTEAMNEEGYSGLSGMDTAANNLEEFQGRLEKARADWGDVFLPLEQGALHAALSMDSNLGGALSMAVVGIQGLIPTVVTGVSAFGEFHRGMEAIKETKIGDWAVSAKDKLGGIGTSIKGIDFTSKFAGLKSALINVASAARTTAASIATTMVSALRSAASAAVTLATELAAAGKAALLAGYNALKSAALWAAEKAAKIASSVASGIATAAQWALNIAMSANPIMLVVLAIAALIAILAYLYFNNEQVRNAINALGQALVYVGQLIYSVAITAVQNLVSAWQNTISFFTTLPGRIGQILSNVINRVVSWASQMISRFRTAATQAVNNFINGIAQLPGRVYNELAKTLNRVIQWGSQIVAKLSSIAQQAWQAFVSGLGIGSPGYIQILTLKELDDTAEGMARIKRTMMTNIRNTASGVVDAWGNPVFNYGFSADTALDELANGGFGGEINMGDTGLIRAIYSLVTALEQFTSDNTNNGDMTFILNGDMDNEDRMKRFLEYVRRELFWNNKTANRTV